jgi:methionine-rich copper-binding protein CopC
MKRAILALFGILSLSGTAFAHSHLEKSTPADGSTVAVAPAELALQFSKPARLTMATIQKEGEELQKLTAPDSIAAQLKVPLPKLATGKYTVKLRFAGADGHVMDGELHFSIGAEKAQGNPTPASKQQPD